MLFLDEPTIVPRLFADLGVAITSVAVSQPALDDVFLRYTGTTIRDAETGGGVLAYSALAGGLPAHRSPRDAVPADGTQSRPSARCRTPWRDAGARRTSPRATPTSPTSCAAYRINQASLTPATVALAPVAGRGNIASVNLRARMPASISRRTSRPAFELSPQHRARLDAASPAGNARVTGAPTGVAA